LVPILKTIFSALKDEDGISQLLFAVYGTTKVSDTLILLNADIGGTLEI